MIAPKKWRHLKWLLRSKNVTRSDLTLPLRDHPMLNPDETRSRIRPICDIAGSKDSGHISFEKLVDHNAVVRWARARFGCTAMPTTTRSQSKLVPSSFSLQEFLLQRHVPKAFRRQPSWRSRSHVRNRGLLIRSSLQP